MDRDEFDLRASFVLIALCDLVRYTTGLAEYIADHAPADDARAAQLLQLLGEMQTQARQLQSRAQFAGCSTRTEQ